MTNQLVDGIPSYVGSKGKDFVILARVPIDSDLDAQEEREHYFDFQWYFLTSFPLGLLLFDLAHFQLEKAEGKKTIFKRMKRSGDDDVVMMTIAGAMHLEAR